MKANLRVFNNKDEYLTTAIVNKTTTFTERLEAVKTKFSEDSFKELVAYWIVEDAMKEYPSNETAPLSKEEKELVNTLPTGEPKYVFTSFVDNKEVTTNVYLSELTDEHLNLMMSDLINKWNILPGEVHRRFIHHLNDVIVKQGLQETLFGAKSEEVKETEKVKKEQDAE